MLLAYSHELDDDTVKWLQEVFLHDIPNYVVWKADHHIFVVSQVVVFSEVDIVFELKYIFQQFEDHIREPIFPDNLQFELGLEFLAQT